VSLSFNLTPIGVIVLFLLLGVLLAALLLGSRPSLARLRRALYGAVLGGLVGIFSWALFAEELFTFSYDVTVFLTKYGIPRPRSVFHWIMIYVFTGVVFFGMAVGAALGWWMKRERAK